MIYDPTLEFYRQKAKVRLQYFFDKGFGAVKQTRLDYSHLL